MNPNELAEAVRAGLDRLKRASLELASQGWSVPMSLTPAETYEILEAGSPEATDARFVCLYEADEGRYFEQLADALLKRDVLAPWRILLEQTLAAYKRRDFAITVPSLLTVCEGLLMVGQGNRTDVRTVVRDRVEAADRKLPESLTAIVWRNVHCFIDELFQRSDFSGTRPGRLNRHWILHGRDASQWSQADCLRLLQAIDTISSLSDHHAV